MLKINWKPIAVAVALTALAGCATPPPPPPPAPPPPPPVVEVEPIPYRPIPPRGAAYRMEVPPVAADGERMTVNYGLDGDETVWHFRSAWNVAALNCLQPGDEIITTAYGQFLNAFPNGLRSANQTMDRRFREEYAMSREAIQAREQHSTRVYNYFAMPGARADLCAAARQIATRFETYEGDDVKDFAAANMPLFEDAFLDFFDEYEKYQQLSAEWDREYGEQYGASQPGYVAIYGTRRPSVGVSLVGDQPEPSDGVLDPETGATVPVVPAPDSSVRTPVVQPVTEGEEEDREAAK